MFQATVKSSFSVEGIGVHSNATTKLTIHPAEINTGIIYKFNDEEILAKYDNVTDTSMSTKISNSNGTSIMTIEHLSAALYALGITNAIIDIDNNEMPIMDGSAKIFAEKFLAIGIQKQEAKVKLIKILKPVTVSINDKHVSLLPGDGFTLDVECNFSAKGLKTEREIFEFGKDDFITQIAPARTFGFMDEVEYVRARGLAKGSSLDNTVVFDKNGTPINEGGLRIPNEPARHKLLDAIGDLSLAGGLLQGKYEAYCPGHQLNNLLLRKLFSDNANYEIII